MKIKGEDKPGAEGALGGRTTYADIEYDARLFIRNAGPRKELHRLGSHKCWQQCYTRYEDEIFFVQHPSETSYCRKAVPGEFGIDLPRNTTMLVEKLDLGGISRTAYQRGKRLPIAPVVDFYYERHIHMKGVSL